MSETDMTEVPQAAPGTTGGETPLHERVADLLDGVTTAAPAAAPPPTMPGAGPGAQPPSAPSDKLGTVGTPAGGAAAGPKAGPPDGALPGAPMFGPAQSPVTAAPSGPAASLPPPGAVGEPASPLAAAPPPALPSAAPPPAPAINIKGRTDGITVELGKGSWPELLAALNERLEQSASFFRQGRVALDAGPRTIVEDELVQLMALLAKNGMSLGLVRTSSERTFQAALAVGLTVTLESAEGVPVVDATPAVTNATAAAYFVYRGYLRSGHRLRRDEHVVVIGDVNPGAEVISAGDILVFGRLRGSVHAGFGGNRRAIVAALDLDATQLRIADVATIMPDGTHGKGSKWLSRRSRRKRPEVARLAGVEILVEEWDESRPGGLVSLRRGG